jgi:hypothetical protein
MQPAAFSQKKCPNQENIQASNESKGEKNICAFICEFSEICGKYF